MRVQGRNGDLLIGGADFSVTPHGLVYNSNGVFVDRLLVTAPAEGTEVRKFDNGMFIAANAEIMDVTTVYQNHLEQSNVDMNEEYTGLIEAQRALQACASALKMVDKINEKLKKDGLYSTIIAKDIRELTDKQVEILSGILGMDLKDEKSAGKLTTKSFTEEERRSIERIFGLEKGTLLGKKRKSDKDK